MGYTKIRLIVKNGYKWLAELVGAELEVEVYEDDFEIDNAWIKEKIRADIYLAHQNNGATYYCI